MYCTRKLTEQVWWVGGSDRRLALFENLFPITRGVSYNSYLILDEQTAVVDTVDSSISRQFLENVLHTLDGRPLDYLVINHMEPALRRCCSASPLSNWWATPRPSPLWGNSMISPWTGAPSPSRKGIPSPWAGIPSNSI